MGLIDKIKKDVKKSGNSKSKFIYFKQGAKLRVRFLTDMDDGMEVKFHDSFQDGINVPCQEVFGRNCEYCDIDEDSGIKLRTRSQYVWSVWDYEAKEVKLFMFAVNQCSPIPALMAMYENYGTLTDRDYVISVSGKGPDKTFQVVPMDKQKFRNSKAKPFSEKAVLKMLDKAYPDENAENDDDDETPKKKSKKPQNKKSQKKKSQDFDDEDEDEDFEDYDDEDFDDEDEDDENDYSSMSPKELYKLCKEREIEAKPKKNAKYYINLLEEYDEAQDDWGEDEDDEYDEDDWSEDDDE